jgi:hypothetical protein
VLGLNGMFVHDFSSLKGVISMVAVAAGVPPWM